MGKVRYPRMGRCWTPQKQPWSCNRQVNWKTRKPPAIWRWCYSSVQERGLQLDIITLNSLISNNTVKAWLKALELLGSGVESNLQMLIFIMCVFGWCGCSLALAFFLELPIESQEWWEGYPRFESWVLMVVLSKSFAIFDSFYLLWGHGWLVRSDQINKDIPLWSSSTPYWKHPSNSVKPLMFDMVLASELVEHTWTDNN